MSARVEIQPCEIRKGDLLRWEGTDDNAREWRAVSDDAANLPWMAGKTYLLDRPTPAVTLPSVPTLGWLIAGGAGPRLGHWHQYTSTFGGNEYAIQGEVEFPVSIVTAFTEAVAVPKSALDELRAWVWPDYAARTFLAAVDNASTR